VWRPRGLWLTPWGAARIALGARAGRRLRTVPGRLRELPTSDGFARLVTVVLVPQHLLLVDLRVPAA